MKVEVYPVGILASLLHDWHMVIRLHGHPRFLWREVGYIRRMARRGEWRAVRMAFNGYLAEPDPWPEGVRRCGSGWTKRRALRSLRRQCGKVGAS